MLVFWVLVRLVMATEEALFFHLVWAAWLCCSARSIFQVMTPKWTLRRKAASARSQKRAWVGRGSAVFRARSNYLPRHHTGHSREEATASLIDTIRWVGARCCQGVLRRINAELRDRVCGTGYIACSGGAGVPALVRVRLSCRDWIGVALRRLHRLCGQQQWFLRFFAISVDCSDCSADIMPVKTDAPAKITAEPKTVKKKVGLAPNAGAPNAGVVEVDGDEGAAATHTATVPTEVTTALLWAQWPLREARAMTMAGHEDDENATVDLPPDGGVCFCPRTAVWEAVAKPGPTKVAAKRTTAWGPAPRASSQPKTLEKRMTKMEDHAIKQEKAITTLQTQVANVGGKVDDLSTLMKQALARPPAGASTAAPSLAGESVGELGEMADAAEGDIVEYTGVVA